MWLDRLRQKPKAVRDQYAFWGAVLVTAVVAGVWAVGASVSLNQTVESTTAVKSSDSYSAFGNFINNAKQAFEGVVNESEEVSVATESVDTASSTSNATSSETSEGAFSFETSTTSIASSTPAESPTGRTILIGTTSSNTE